MRTETTQSPKNLICNFRAPTPEHFQKWQDWKAWCQLNGRDVCYMTLSLIEAAMAGKGIEGQNVTINLTSNYQVQQPRRVPYDLSCIREPFRKTFSSILYESYVLTKANDLGREFCFRDFLEMDHDAFRRIVRRLIRKGKIVKNPLRTVPQFYFLASKLKDYRP